MGAPVKDRRCDPLPLLGAMVAESTTLNASEQVFGDEGY